MHRHDSTAGQDGPLAEAVRTGSTRLQTATSRSDAI